MTDARKFLLTQDQIQKLPAERKVHFLNPKGIRATRSLGDAVGLKHMGVHLVEIDPGNETVEPHIHHMEEEAFYVLSGRGAVQLDDARHPIQAGDFVGLPRKSAVHNIINDGTEKLVCLVFGQRLEADFTDYPNKAKRLFRIGGEWNLVDYVNLLDPRK